LVLPVSDRHLGYAQEVAARLAADGLRARVDDRGESIGRKIRDAELAKVPYMLVVGDREAEAGTAALRRHREGDLGTLTLDEIAQRLTAEAASGYTPSH
jgi:threonyl-tRNA synthetase